MNIQSLKGSWEHLQGSLKQKYGKLTDDDLKYVEGQEEELYGKIQSKLGVTREKVQSIILEHLEALKEKKK